MSALMSEPPAQPPSNRTERRRIERQARRESASQPPADLGFKPAFFLSFGLGLLGLATRASLLTDMIGESQLAPFVTVACLIGSAVFFIIGMAGLLRRHITFQRPIVNISPIANIAALLLIVLSYLAICASHPVTALEIVL